MSVAEIYIRVFVAIDNIAQSGAIVKLIDNVTGREFWTGYTDAQGYTDWALCPGMTAGDLVRVYAHKHLDGFDYTQIRVVALSPHLIVSFRFVRQEPEPEPSRQYGVSIIVEANLPDPAYTGKYWVANPDEIPVIRTALTGVRAVIKKGYDIVYDAITNVSGEARTALYEGTYSVTLTMEGYKTITDTIVVSGQHWSKTYFMEPGPEGAAPFDLPDWEKYLTWTNIAKAGAVVVLVGFGSEAFKKFREAFKK